MMKINKHLNLMLIMFEYFNSHEWSFYRNNITDMMMNVMTLKDSNVVKLDLQDMDWEKYITNYQMGMKKFLLKENSESANATRRRISLYVLTYLDTKVDIIMIIIFNVRLMIFLFILDFTGHIRQLEYLE